MAELATIARPYAEALFRAGIDADATAQLSALVDVTRDPLMRQFADSPKVSVELVFNVISDVLARKSVMLAPAVQNLLRTVLENGRLPVLPEILAQYQVLRNRDSGVSDALIESAFAIDDQLLSEVVASLEKRFGRKLNARVEVQPELIGGIRAVVGDEVLDTSVRARLEQMKVALTA
jgi:F-type H+-transporting ATPase subunit delta